jgi:hypothetical protein
VNRLVLVLAAIGVVCWWRSSHDPKRHYLGGQKCRTCGKPGADRDALGEDGTLRGTRYFSRSNGGEFIRGAGWEEYTQ